MLRGKLRSAGLAEIEVVHGAAGTVRVAAHPEADFVVSAIVGVSGLEATYEAVRAGKTVGLANKGCMVVAGELITAEARKQGKPLLPIDSEHNAIHQCLRGGRMDAQVNEVERIWLTASGGPFLNTPKSEFGSITVQQALNHPTWKMGKRITIDSVTTYASNNGKVASQSQLTGELDNLSAGLSQAGSATLSLPPDKQVLAPILSQQVYLVLNYHFGMS